MTQQVWIVSMTEEPPSAEEVNIKQIRLELLTMHKIAKLLSPLGEMSRSKVLRWLWGSYGDKTAVEGKP